ncbi:MAG: hypothetical protein ABEJ24_05950 [Candidatus Magasanikbacteria bacterium]
MQYLKKFISDSKYIFGLAILLAFLFPTFASSTQAIIVPALALAMVFSLKNFEFKYEKGYGKSVALLLFLVYIFQAALFIILPKLFLSKIEYQQAFYIYAAMPPAVAVISLTYLFDGDIQTSFLAETASYILSLLLIPLIIWFMLGDSISLMKIVEPLVYMILLPLMVSRLVRKKEDKIPEVASKGVINICLGLVNFTIIGLNKEVLISNPANILLIAGIIIFIRFIIGTGVFFTLKKYFSREFSVVATLFSTFKNGGAAIAFTAILIGTSAALPLAVNAIIFSFHIMFLSWFFEKEKRSELNF